MNEYYKLLRRDDLIPVLQAKILEDRRWRDQLKDAIPTRAYYITEGYGEQRKSVSLSELPPNFLIKESPISLAALLTAGMRFMGKFLERPIADTSRVNEEDNTRYALVCNLDKVAPETREGILRILGAIVPPQEQDDLGELLDDFHDDKNSLSRVAPQYILKHFPLTHSEEMVYNTVFVRHPLVGYEGMLVPLEKYYKFLSDQSFSEFLTILVKLGVKKVELVHSENQLMRNALNAYVGAPKIFNASAGYAMVAAESGHAYWGMEFEGRQISPEEISEGFLAQFPFHGNNGTIRAMIEGIKSGNRNKTYTVERSFTGTYGLAIGAAIEVLGFRAGFDFDRSTYHDEKSTFNVLY